MIHIPNIGSFDIHSILLDYNGTIAKSGQPLDIKERLVQLSKIYKIYVITGDTYGAVREQLKDYPVECIIAYTADEKEAFIETVHPENCIAIGNGNIDHKMLKKAALGIAVLEDEGVSAKAIQNSDLLVKSIDHAFDMIDDPKKLIATLKE